MEMQAKAELVEVIRERYLCSIKKQRARGHSTLRPALWAALLAALWAIHLIASAALWAIHLIEVAAQWAALWDIHLIASAWAAALWAIHLIASAVDHEIQVLRMLLSVLTKPAY